MSIHSEPIDKIVACVHALRDLIPTQFILVGGAAACFQGHPRLTNDVDILIRDMSILDRLKTVDGFEVVDGKLSYQSVQIDLLTTIDNRISYEQVDEHVEAVQGIRLLKPDFALAVKVKCSYLRQEDVKGIEKQASDLKDAIFWARKLKEAGLRISDSCAKLFPIGYYEVICLRMCMNTDDFHQLVDVGLRKLLIPWEENSPEQREYYSCFAAAWSDPFTVKLGEDEEYDEYVE